MRWSTHGVKVKLPRSHQLVHDGAQELVGTRKSIRNEILEKKKKNQDLARNRPRPNKTTKKKTTPDRDSLLTVNRMAGNA